MRRMSYSRDSSSTWKISNSVTNILMQLTE